MRPTSRATCGPSAIRSTTSEGKAGLEGITDRWLYEQTTYLGSTPKLSPFSYMERKLLAVLPRIRATVTNLEEDRGIAKVVHEIWTPAQPDVRTAVKRIWAPDRREELLTEANWFARQMRPHLLQIAILDTIATRLCKSRIRVVHTTESATLEQV
jgi:hypothetical protein